MSLLGWIVIGGVAGSLAQSITGTPKRGCLNSIVIGVIGAVVGGALFSAATDDGLTGFSWRSLLVALVGAVGFLLVLQAVGGRSSRRR
jgi:uncharacterized membrane protein YeaQ/YmgE (transglycosylase-associated protein family)